MSNQRASQADEERSNSDVLSESTDLNSLLVAILGQDREDGDDRAQLIATIDSQVGEVIKELGLEELLAERRRREEEAIAAAAAAAVAQASAELALQRPDSVDSVSNAPAERTLRQTIGRFFLWRTSVWIVLVAGVGAAGVSVSVLNRPQGGALAASEGRRDAAPAASDASSPASPLSVAPPSATSDVRKTNTTAPAVSEAPARGAIDPQMASTAALVPARRETAMSTSTAPAATSTPAAPTASTTETSRTEPPTAPPTVETPATTVPSTAPPTESPPPPTATAPAVAVAPDRPSEAVSNAASPRETPAPVTTPPDASVIPSTGSSSTPAIPVDRRMPRPIVRRAPDYPAALRSQGVGGTVQVSFTVDELGHVRNVAAVSGPLPLRATAEAAVLRWRYEPATENNVPVATDLTVNLTFEPPRPRRQ